MEKVFWSTAEIAQLAEILVPMRLSDPQPPLLTLLKKAQMQLPAHRRRPMRTVGPELLQQLKVKLDWLHKKALTPLPELPKVPSPEEILAGLPPEKLLYSAIVSMMQGMRDSQRQLAEAQEKFQALAYRQLSHISPNGDSSINIPNKQKRVRVVVVGLLNNQQNHVKKALGGRLDLRFVSKDQKKPSFPEAEKIVLCCDFIDHGWENAAFQKFPHDQVIRHKGGISGLINILQGL